MREILFRGQRIDNGEWIEGFYFYKDRTSQHGIHCSISMGVLVDREFEVLPETVGQFTGLTDKNGVKIFEGDKVYFDYNYIGEIIVSWDISGKFNIQGYVFSKCKIIGNVHENTKN